MTANYSFISSEINEYVTSDQAILLGCMPLQRTTTVFRLKAR